MGNQKDKDLEALFFSKIQNDAEVIPIIADDDEEALSNTEMPNELPIIPLRNTVLFPGVVMPITVGRDKSLKLIHEANNGNKLIGCVSQKNPEIEEPKPEDLYSVGSLAKILKVIEMPDGTVSVIIQGQKRFEITSFVTVDPYFVASVRSLMELRPYEQDNEFLALVGSLKDIALRIVKLNQNIPHEVTFAIRSIQNSSFLINFICSNSDIELKDKQDLLEINDIKERATKLLEILSKQVEMLKLKQEIQNKAKQEITQQQKEYLLHQQMKTIQNELGGNPMEQEVNNLNEKAQKKDWAEYVAKHFEKEVNKLQFMNPAAGEYSVQLNYLQTLLDVPWTERTEDNFDLKFAQKVLDADHYGLEKVKDRIIEHLAVLKLKGDMKAPILCLVGPPGVGKTSLGKSVARALGRKYVRMSLGGLHDESEIRGHRKTYIGAMPGRIIQNIRKVKSINPVFVLDEIDKVGSDFRGDPASALLEVLDPEQNKEFHDNYLEVDYDLSNVMFIATANTTSTINPALRDRMEMIDVSGYILEEKVEIAKRHLILKQRKAHGVEKNKITISDKAVSDIVEFYTKESGVRGLDKQIAKLIRQIAKRIAMDEKYPKSIKPEHLTDLIGNPKFFKDQYIGNEHAGVVTGLAWTPVGGDILYMETSLSRGKGNLTITGNLGDVMKESASIAMEYIKANADLLNIETEIFEKWNVHMHVPEGAIPKDGPSAGITMAVSVASAFTQRKVKRNLAMTGEITLRGHVLPVGGIKEKILAAKRAGINEIILSKLNEKDIKEIPEIYIKGLKFHFVETILDVLNIALLKQKVKDAKSITV